MQSKFRVYGSGLLLGSNNVLMITPLGVIHKINPTGFRFSRGTLGTTTAFPGGGGYPGPWANLVGGATHFLKRAAKARRRKGYSCGCSACMGVTRSGFLIENMMFI